MDLVDVWPLFSLRLITPRLELRVARDEDIPGIAEAALAGIHDPERMPFARPWTEAPPEELVPNLARHLWSERAGTRPGDWGVLFVVLEGGVPIGVQALRARDFGTLRTVSSGSWLTRSRHGLGYGTEMRAAMLSGPAARHPAARRRDPARPHSNPNIGGNTTTRIAAQPR